MFRQVYESAVQRAQEVEGNLGVLMVVKATGLTEMGHLQKECAQSQCESRDPGALTLRMKGRRRRRKSQQRRQKEQPAPHKENLQGSFWKLSADSVPAWCGAFSSKVPHQLCEAPFCAAERRLCKSMIPLL